MQIVLFWCNSRKKTFKKLYLHLPVHVLTKVLSKSVGNSRENDLVSIKMMINRKQYTHDRRIHLQVVEMRFLCF